MNLAKLSTTKTFIVGPILDTAGVAKTDEVVASIKVTKNGTVGAVDAQDTLTHNHTGHYVFVSDGGDFDTLGEVEFSLNSGTNAMAPVKFQVLPAATYDAIVTNAAGGANGMLLSGASNKALVSTCDTVTSATLAASQHVIVDSGTVTTLTGLTAADVGAIKTKTDYLPSVAAGGAGGVFIAGTNAATTITTSLTTTFTGNLTGSVASCAAATLAASQHVIVDSGTITTYTGNTLQTADIATLIATVGAAGAGLTGITGAKVSVGTGAGQINVSSGVVPASGNWNTTTPPTVAAIATGVWQDATAGDFTTADSVGKSLYNAFTAGTSVYTVAALANAPTGGSAPTAAQIATGVWQDATAGDFTTAGSIGKSLFTSGNAPGAASGLPVLPASLKLPATVATGDDTDAASIKATIGAAGAGLTAVPMMAADRQKLAQIRYGCSGTVWYASPAGSGANSGLDPTAPKPILDITGYRDSAGTYTPGTMAMGDVVVLSSTPSAAGLFPIYDLGSYGVGEVGIAPPAFSRVIGPAVLMSGVGSTGGSGVGALNYSQFCHVQDVTVIGRYNHSTTAALQYGIAAYAYGNYGRTIAAEVLGESNIASSTLTTRIDDDSGILTVVGISESVGYAVGDFLQLSFSGVYYRYDVQVTAVTTDGLSQDVTISGGIGRKLPAVSTAVIASLAALRTRGARLERVSSLECYNGLYADYGLCEENVTNGDDFPNLILDNCDIRGRVGGIILDHTGSKIRLKDTRVTVTTSAGVPTITERYNAIDMQQGSTIVELDNSHLVVVGGSTLPAYGIHVNGSGCRVRAHKGSIKVSGGSTNKDIFEEAASAAEVHFSGVDYDPTAISMGGGTFTDEGRIITTTGKAHADKRAVLGTALTEGAAGRLAAADVAYGDVASPLFTAAAAMRGTDSVPTNPLLTTDSRISATAPPTNTQFEARTKATADYADKTTLDTAAADALAAKTAAEAVETTVGAAGAGLTGLPAVALKATGLDAITKTTPTTPMAEWTFAERLTWLFRRFAGKAIKTKTALTVYKDNGTTPLSVQVVSEVGNTETQGESADAS